MYFNTASGVLHAVDDVSFSIEKGKPWDWLVNPDVANLLWGVH